MDIRAKLGRFWALSVLVFASPLLWAQGDYFNANKEFPNYFLPAQYRGLKPDQIPKPVVDASREALEFALASLFHRLQVPVFLDGRYQSVSYFDYLHTRLREIDRTVEVVPSGGVIRSAISYIYSEIYRAIEKDSRKSPEEVLKEIATDKKLIPAHVVRGVGSDFDTLLYKYNPRYQRAISKLATDITNSAESASGMTSSTHASKRAFFTIADFKDYSAQTERSTDQGGSDVDFLAFDVLRGKFIMPPSDEGGTDYSVIANNLVSGYYRYLPPISRIEDGAKQTVRGFRPLLELPFIQLLDETQLRKEIRTLSNGTLSAKAKEQFDKMVRNARFAGAHNRIYRSRPSTLEAEIRGLVESTARKRKENPLIPEFVDELPLGRESSIPSELLMPLDRFISNYTDRGIVYHGHPEISSGLSIMRQGLFISGGEFKQGTAAMRRGGYTTHNLSLASGFAKGKGLIFRLPVKRDPRTRILDWRSVKTHPWIKKIESQYSHRDLFEVLAREFGVDIIVNGHVLIQNISALEMNTSLDALLQSIADSIDGLQYSTPKEIDEGLKVMREFGALKSYQSALGSGEVTWPDTTPLARVLRHRILSGESINPAKDLPLLRAMSEHARARAENLSISDGDFNALVFKEVKAAQADDSLPKIHKAIVYLLAWEQETSPTNTQLTELLGPLTAKAYAHFMSKPKQIVRDAVLANAIEVIQRRNISLAGYRELFETTFKRLGGGDADDAFQKMKDASRWVGGGRIIPDLHDLSKLESKVLEAILNVFDLADVKYFPRTGKTIVIFDTQSLRDLRALNRGFPSIVADYLYLACEQDRDICNKLFERLSPQAWGFKGEAGLRRLEKILYNNPILTNFTGLAGVVLKEYSKIKNDQLTLEEYRKLLPAYHLFRANGLLIKFEKWEWDYLVQLFKLGLAQDEDREIAKKVLVDWMIDQPSIAINKDDLAYITRRDGNPFQWSDYSDEVIAKLIRSGSAKNEFFRSLTEGSEGLRRLERILSNKTLLDSDPRLSERVLESIYNSKKASLAAEDLRQTMAAYRVVRDKGVFLGAFAKWKLDYLAEVFKAGMAENEDHNLVRATLTKWMTNPASAHIALGELREAATTIDEANLWSAFSNEQLATLINSFSSRNDFSLALYKSAFRASLGRKPFPQIDLNSYFDHAKVNSELREEVIWRIGPKDPRFWRLVNANLRSITSIEYWAKILKLSELFPDERREIVMRLVANYSWPSPVKKLALEIVGQTDVVDEKTLEWVVNYSADYQEILIAFNKKTRLSDAFVTQHILPLAVQYKQPAPMKVLKNQQFWSPAVAEVILNNFSNFKYEDKVLFLRKMIAMKTPWNNVMRSAMSKLDEDRGLVNWAMSAYEKRSCALYLN